MTMRRRRRLLMRRCIRPSWLRVERRSHDELINLIRHYLTVTPEEFFNPEARS